MKVLEIPHAQMVVEARRLISAARQKTAASPNETVLRHELETELERSCKTLGIPWTAFTLDKALPQLAKKGTQFVDAVHGAVVIEYEPPNSFGGSEGAKLKHAQGQARDYTLSLAGQEGRELTSYVMLAWDGSHVSFGRFPQEGAEPEWGRLVEFDESAAIRMLEHLNADGIPLVHPMLLSVLAGPESDYGKVLLPAFYRAIRQAAARPKTTKTKLLYTEWRRIFGQAMGAQSERLRSFLDAQSTSHGVDYREDVPAYLFALNTLIAIVAKLAAALSLPNASQDLRDESVSIEDRIRLLESGELFRDAGVLNMLDSDFFSWYLDDTHWRRFEKTIRLLLAQLGAVDFDVRRKHPDSIRDLFKGMYMQFVPPALRHALGEIYTPDWLAEHALNAIEWKPESSLTDPTCGTGTFVLEALRRRLAVCPARASAEQLVRGLCGIDLNPLAVLAARASIVVYLSPRLVADKPVLLPVFLADAINPASREGSVYRHRLQTELGVREFAVPAKVVEHNTFFQIFQRLRQLIYEPDDATAIYTTLAREYGLELGDEDKSAFIATIEILKEFREKEWDGIWCSILAERFAVGSIKASSTVAGNPPWVKWSNLPREYAAFIKPRCEQLGVFSEDRWVGGIESDISTVITHETIEKWLGTEGTLAFFITGTVFKNESSQGFRRFRLSHLPKPVQSAVLFVEDFNEVAPFEGVINHPTLLVLKRDSKLRYPVQYRIWSSDKRVFANDAQFLKSARLKKLLAAPVPGTDAGPWLVGTRKEHKIWRKIFGQAEARYQARKGVTTDLNGVFFVRVSEGPNQSTCYVENTPSLGRKARLPRVRSLIEKTHVYPLMRGRGVSPFNAQVDPDYSIIVPQSGMQGNPTLPTTARRTWAFLNRFRRWLERRSSYKRFQSKSPWWSLWSTGAYTFKPWKVLWKEMGGHNFVAAYVGTHASPVLGRKVIIPDHKIYFIPCDTENEAAFLTALLNSPLLVNAISSYASQLSMGVSVAEYVRIPTFDPNIVAHEELSTLGRTITHRGGNPTPAESERLDALAKILFGLN